MSELKIIKKCPLGMDCERIVDNTIERCEWYQEIITGRNAQTDEKLKKRVCVMILNNLLLMESNKRLVGNQAAIESLRNETVNGQNEFNNLFQQAIKKNNGIKKIG